VDCLEAREAILDGVDDAAPVRRPEVDAHVSGCPACEMFARAHQVLDARLAGLPRPDLSPVFRTRLKREIRKDKMRVLSDALPDVVHLGSCGLATVLCSMLAPLDAGAVLSAGTAATLITYLLMNLVRYSLDRADQPDW
jgi:predicted anti-sigma-YlaC factor YlaD